MLNALSHLEPRQPARTEDDEAASGGATGAQASQERDKRKGKKRSSLYEIAETLLLAVLIFVMVRSVVLNFRVDGASMEPSLHHGEMLIVNRRAYTSIDVNQLLSHLPGVERQGEREWYIFNPPKRGDIVVFQPPGPHREPYIKRIIGLPGERVLIRDGAVFIDGQRLDEPYLQSDTVWQGMTAHEFTVEPDHVFVLGDNRGNSSDSRIFGTVPMSDIIGRAWVAYWPPGQMQLLPQPVYAID